MNPLVDLGLSGLAWLLYHFFHLSYVGSTSAFVILSSYTAYSKQFDIGTLYSFTYSSWVTLNEPQKGFEPSSKDVGFKIDLDVGISPIWQHPVNSDEQLFEMKISPPKLSVKAGKQPSPSTFVPKPSRADKLQLYSFYIHREGGKIKKIFRTDKESITAVNIKKGIASLFQYQTKGTILSEIDSSGRCDVSYVHDSRGYFTKVKENCRPIDDFPFQNHTSKVLSALVQSSVKSSYILSDEDGSLKSADTWEAHILSAYLRPEKGAEVIARQMLNRTGTAKSDLKIYKGKALANIVKIISEELKQSLVGEKLSVIPPQKECIQCKTLKDLVDTYRPSLQTSNFATQSACIAFLKLLRKVRESTREEIRDLLRDRRNSNIKPQLIDVIGAAQTIQAHQAIRDVVKFTSPVDIPERYLLALALNTHPLESVIDDLLLLLNKGINDEKVYDSTVLAISSMANTFMKNPRNKNKKIVSKVLQYVRNELENAKTKDRQLTMLRALQNIVSKSSMETLLFYATLSGSDNNAVAVQAMRALQTMPEDFFNLKIFKQLHRVVFQLDSIHDSSVRAMAYDILLKYDLSDYLIRDVFKLIGAVRDKEMNTLFLTMTKEASLKNDEVKLYVKNLLAECHLDNYYIESQSGLSSALSRDLSDPKSTTSLSFTNLLEITGGLLKRSTVDVYLRGNQNLTIESADKVQKPDDSDRLNLLNFGIFAGGMSMFGGEDAVDDGQESNAGIEISVLGAGLRPIVFFTGQGELMGHVWSGTGSERTSALRSSIPLQDHFEIIAMQNGLTAEVTLNGVISLDFAGQIQISLWNRNAHSLVEVEAASVVRGQLRVDNSFVQTMVEFNYGSQSELDFVSDLDFANEIMMCLQMVQQDFNLVDSIRKLESIPGSSYALRKYKRKVYPVPGRTYAMNKKNTQFCNLMFK